MSKPAHPAVSAAFLLGGTLTSIAGWAGTGLPATAAVFVGTALAGVCGTQLFAWWAAPTPEKNERAVHARIRGAFRFGWPAKLSVSPGGLWLARCEETGIWAVGRTEEAAMARLGRKLAKELTRRVREALPKGAKPFGGDDSDPPVPGPSASGDSDKDARGTT